MNSNTKGNDNEAAGGSGSHGMSRASKRKRKNKEKKKLGKPKLQQEQGREALSANIGERTEVPGQHTEKNAQEEKPDQKSSRFVEDTELSPSMISSFLSNDEAVTKNGKDLIEQYFLDSKMKGEAVMGWLVAPVAMKDFFQKYWEKQPVLVNRHAPNYFKGWLARQEVEAWLRQQQLHLESDLVMEGVDSKGMPKRFPDLALPGEEAAAPAEVNKKQVWEMFRSGMSMVFTRPQKYSDPVWKLASQMEEIFSCCVDASAVLSPAPGPSPDGPPLTAAEHTIVMQLEGSESWQIWPAEVVDPDEDVDAEGERSLLQRQKELARALGKTVVGGLPPPSPTAEDEAQQAACSGQLQPGDLLYLPRGCFYQVQSLSGSPGTNGPASLRLQASVSGGSDFGDLLNILVPQALTNLVSGGSASSIARTCLPRGYLGCMGVANASVSLEEDQQDGVRSEAEVSRRQQRDTFREKVKGCLRALLHEAEEILDAACDQMAVQFISGRLPPPITSSEEGVTVPAVPPAAIGPETQLKCLHNSEGCIARLVIEKGGRNPGDAIEQPGHKEAQAAEEAEPSVAVVYHCADNSRGQRGENPICPLEFGLDDAPAIEALLNAHPDPVMVKDIPRPPTEDLDEKISIAEALFKEGILMVHGDQKLSQSINNKMPALEAISDSDNQDIEST